MRPGIWLPWIWLAVLSCGRDPSPATKRIDLPEPALEELGSATRTHLEHARAEVLDLLETRDSRRGDALWRLGRLYLAYDLNRAATEVLSVAADFGSQDPDRAYLLGVAQQRILDLEQAEQSFEHSLNLRPGDLATLGRLARVELDLGKLRRSRELFEEVLRREPSSALAHFGLGVIANEEGQPELAVAHLSSALKLQPEATAAHYPLAMALRNLGHIDEAKDHLAQAGSLRPAVADARVAALSELLVDSRAHLARGDRVIVTGDIATAITFYRKAVALDPENARVLHNLGAALGRAGQHADALAYLRRAVQLDPSNRDARFDLAMSLANTGNLVASAEQLEVVLQLDPSDREAAKRLATVSAALTGKPGST